MQFILSLLIAFIFSALLSGIAAGFSQTGDLSFQFSAWQTLAGTVSALAGLITYRLMSPRSSSPRAGKSKSPRKSAATSDCRQDGKVKWFNPKKGFGFIACDNGDEVFVHYRNIEGDGRRILREGQSVTFLVIQSDKGPQAEDVRAAD